MQFRLSYLFSYEELLVLLKGQKYEQCHLFSDKKITLNKEQSIQILNNLSKKDIIASDGKTFRIYPEYKKILDDIAGAKKIVIFHNNNDMQDFCVYMLSDKLLKCEAIPLREGMYQFEYLSYINFKEDLIYYGVIYEDNELEKINRKHFSDNIGFEKSNLEVSIEELMKKPEVYSYAQIIYPGKNKEHLLVLNEKDLVNAILLFSEEGEKKIPYTADNYLNILFNKQ